MFKRNENPKIDIDGREVELNDLQVQNDKRLGVYAMVFGERLPLSEDTLDRMKTQIETLMEERQPKN